MAKIELTGFVNEWRKANPEKGLEELTHPNWAMKVAESHRKKNEAGELEVSAYTYRTIKANYGAQIDFTQFSKGDRVTVIGYEITEIREGTDGRKYRDLVVKADSVVIVPPAEQAPAEQFQAPEGWAVAPADDDAPF